MISVYRPDQVKRFAPLSYLNHSFILNLNVKVCIRFTVFVQISLFFFICQELCWMRDLCISFKSSSFLFPVVKGIKKFKNLEVGGGGVKNFRTGWVIDLEGGHFCLGEGQYPITCHVKLNYNINENLHIVIANFPLSKIVIDRIIQKETTVLSTKQKSKLS